MNDSTDPRGRPISWIPYGIHEETGAPQLYARYAIPLAVDRYEIGYGVLPLPVVSTTVPTGTATPFTPAEQQTLLACAPNDIPPHLAPYFIPKLVRSGNVVRLGQVRYDEDAKRYCWQVFAQPLRQPTATTVRPQLRVSCPNLDKKFPMEEIIHFTRQYNIRPNGTYYKATPERVCDGRGYGEYGKVAPTVAGTSSFMSKIFYLLLQHVLIFILELQMAYKQGFRWKPADFAIAPTPPNTTPVSVWANPPPVYPIIPADSIIPTGNGLGPDHEAGKSPAPFALGPVPPLQTTLPNPKRRFSQRRITYGEEYHLSKAGTSKASPTQTARPRSKSRSRPSRAVVPSIPPVPATPTLVLAPVNVKGVPGTTIIGVDTVSLSNNTHFITLTFTSDFGFPY